MMKKAIAALMLGAVVGCVNPAFAHGEKPRHGGTVQSVGDVSFELVAQGDTATIYVEDHGKPVSTSGMSGKLTVLNGKDRSEAELKPAGGNKLAAGGLKIMKGTKAVASLTTAAKKTITVRFAVK